MLDPFVLLHAACQTQYRAPPTGESVTVMLEEVRGEKEKYLACEIEEAFIQSFVICCLSLRCSNCTSATLILFNSSPKRN